MALIRVAVNSDEFAERVKASKNSLKSSVGDSYGGYTLQYGDQYDPQKLITAYVHLNMILDIKKE